MKEIEFLPEHHIRLRRSRRLRLIRLWLIVAMALSMTCWALYRRAEVAGVRQKVLKNQLEARAIEDREVESKLAELKGREARYTAQADLVDRLAGPRSRTRLVSEIIRHLPGEIVLTRLEVDRRTRRLEPDGAPRPTSRRRRVEKPAEEETRTVDRVRIEGFAANDLSLARFLQDMADGAFFQQGELAFSRDATFHGKEVRAFSATFYVPSREAGVRQLAAGPSAGGRG